MHFSPQLRPEPRADGACPAARIATENGRRKMRAAVLAIALLMGGTALAQTQTTNGTAGNTGSGDMAGTTTQPTTGQTTGDQTTNDQSTAGQTMGDQSTTGTNTTVQTNSPASTTSSDQTQTGWNNNGQTTLAANTASTGAVVQPSNANPRRDARGVRVISAPAMVPGGYNGTQSNGMGGPLVDPNTGQAVSDTGSARACTRTVTDHCLQTYERHRAR
jgi:hypothetical protein